MADAPRPVEIMPAPGVPRPTWLKPPLTRWRIGLALLVAVVADGLQILLGPIGWAFSDEAIDVIAMVLTSVLIGFHVLLLPTSLLELVPVVGMLPTWTACVIAVIAIRRRQAAAGTAHASPSR